jgi:hypothetical protein
MVAGAAAWEENMPKPFRRIVTTNDANGRSEVHLDGPATNELATVLTEMWVTDAGPHNHTDRVDHAAKSKCLEPPVGGSVFRFVRLPPASASPRCPRSSASSAWRRFSRR